MIGVYKITSPSGKIYIGSSKDIDKRKTHYKSKSSKGQVRLYNSIQKHGWENHIFEVLEECTFDNLYSKELYYGEKYDVLGSNGLNCILPKSGEKKCGVSEETRKKMSECRLGEKNKFYGKTHSSESRKKIGLAHTGRKLSLEHKKKVSENNARNNAKIVLDFNTGVFYNSCKEAADLLGYVHSTLRQRLNGSLENMTSLKYI